ncbi:hypothetical protein HMPREF9554_00349 [Treponema phagedenis F0421]|nr:hypothetical protein HMPREF9554_00349 [Treponema phagedenis F0421]
MKKHAAFLKQRGKGLLQNAWINQEKGLHFFMIYFIIGCIAIKSKENSKQHVSAAFWCFSYMIFS